MKTIVTLIGLLALAPATAQKLLATLEVNNPITGAAPVTLNLDDITFLADTALSLIEVIDGKPVPVVFQVRNGSPRQLHWMLKPSAGKAKRIFQLREGKSSAPAQAVSLDHNDGTLVLKNNGNNLVQYNYKTVYPPPGVDTVYKRSGFIHPLWSPKGQVLTRIQPPDHYHHYGIWNPWTHLLYKGDTLDLWNIHRKQGTVNFASFISQEAGPVFGEYTVLHDHVANRKSGAEIIIKEAQTIRVYASDQDDAYIMDLTIAMSCATEEPVLLLEYRYGGLGWRTTEQWTKDNSTVLTSSGKSRKDADGSKAQWCLIQGAVDNTNAGILMMSHPANYNHPEPLRIWPQNQYNRGDMFANFSPTKDMDWELEPGKTYVLRYRFVVFNGPFDGTRAAQAWEQFSSPPAVVVKAGPKQKS